MMDGPPAQPSSRSEFRVVAQGGTALEVMVIYAGILLYIWRWQYSYPHAWILLWAAILVSHVVHRDTPRSLGLWGPEWRASAQIILPLATVIFVPLVIYGLWVRRIVPLVPSGRQWLSLGGYAAWCVVQQYLTQSYFHRRLMKIVHSPLVASGLVATMFAAAHIPNPVLMAATGIGGFIFAEVFRRHPNIWPLAFAQAVGGFLIAAITPAALIHNMRVGPGYFFYGIR